VWDGLICVRIERGDEDRCAGGYSTADEMKNVYRFCLHGLKASET
jgi:hypothetical protein